MRKKIRKWGNSYGILISKKELESRKLRENQTVEVELEAKPDIRELFGKYKFNRPIQEIKDEMRRGHRDDILL